MKLPYEVEVKLRVEAPAALKRRLKELGFGVAVRRHFETNVVFDFADLRLRKARSLLRLRWEGRRPVPGGTGRQCIVTFKGTPRPSASYKIRREIETEVEEGISLQRVFEALGLRAVFRYEKYRTAYARQDRKGPALLYDETPVGNFVELEGPQKWIDRLANQLGYRRKDYITASYATLYQEHCREKGITPRDMVF